jgi:hypothetical protein
LVWAMSTIALTFLLCLLIIFRTPTVTAVHGVAEHPHLHVVRR